MQGVNLIPDDRQAARGRRGWIRRWATGGWVYGVVLLAVCFVLRLAWGHADPHVANAMSEVQTQIKTGNDAIAQIRAELDQHEFTLRANHDLIEHPDWGLMLGLLAGSLGHELVLRECEITELLPGRTGSGRLARDDAPLVVRSFRLSIRGMGRSQAAVSQFALRLEKAGVFNGVKLVDTSLEPYLKGKAVSFRVECLLSAPGSERP